MIKMKKYNIIKWITDHTLWFAIIVVAIIFIMLIVIMSVSPPEKLEQSGTLIKIERESGRIYLFFDNGEYVYILNSDTSVYSECLPYIDKNVTVYYASRLIFGNYLEKIELMVIE